MYQALRPIISTAPDGQLVQVAPGEVVVGFESWPLRNQIAAINQQMVRRKVDGLGLDYRANERELREEREYLTQLAATNRSGVLQRQAQPPASSTTDEIDAEEMRCGQCDYKTHSAQGLKTHMARKHKR